MRQSQVQVSEEENDAKVEEQAVPPVARKRGRPLKKIKIFSEGLRGRLENYLKNVPHSRRIPLEIYSEGLHQVWELDYSHLWPDQTKEFARVTFELYYTDKTVQKLTFEKNFIKIVAGYSMK